MAFTLMEAAPECWRAISAPHLVALVRAGPGSNAACEALAVLDCAEDIDTWARLFDRAGGASVDPIVPAGFKWRQALGDYDRLPEWIGSFRHAIDDDGLAGYVTDDRQAWSVSEQNSAAAGFRPVRASPTTGSVIVIRTDPRRP